MLPFSVRVLLLGWFAMAFAFADSDKATANPSSGTAAATQLTSGSPQAVIVAPLSNTVDAVIKNGKGEGAETRSIPALGSRSYEDCLKGQSNPSDTGRGCELFNLGFGGKSSQERLVS